MIMTILITACVWVGFFTILNQFEQKHYLALQEQRDELLAALKRLHHISGGWQEGPHAKMAALPETREETLEVINWVVTVIKAGGVK